MSLTRKLPNSDEKITKAINKAEVQLSIVAPADVAVTPATAAKIPTQNTAWNNCNTLCETTLFDQTTATADSVAKKGIAKMFVSHFFQAFNNGVDRDYFAKEQRTFFHLDVNSNSVPTLDSEADIKLWGGRIVNGDILRVAAGGNPMSNPTAAEVKAAVKAFELSNNDQTLKMAAHKNALEARDVLRPVLMALILKIYDETEANYNQFPPPAKRDKCRAWGVVYVSDQIYTIGLTFVDSVTGLKVADTVTFFVEGDTTHNGDSEGFLEIKTTVADVANFQTSAPSYTEKMTQLIFETGIYEYNLTVEMVA